MLQLGGTQRRVRREWSKLGLEPIGLHGARHTAATWLHHAGVSPKVASTLMGEKPPEPQPGVATRPSRARRTRGRAIDSGRARSPTGSGRARRGGDARCHDGAHSRGDRTRQTPRWSARGAVLEAGDGATRPRVGIPPPPLTRYEGDTMTDTVHIPVGEAEGTVADVMLRDARAVPPDTPLQEVRERFANPRVRLMLVADGDRFLGTLGRAEVPDSGDGPIGPHVRADAERLRAEDPVSRAVALLEETGEDRIPVVDAEGRLEGLVCLNRAHHVFCATP